MTDNIPALTTAATQVMQALEALETDERERVLRSVAALYGIQFRAAGSATRGTDPGSSSGKDEEDLDAGGARGGKRVSLVEFVKDKHPATNAQRIAVFGYYREHSEEKGQYFAKADLLPYFATAKVSKPGNYDRDWKNVVREGWIHDEGARSYLTDTGEKVVRAGFGGKAKPRGRTKKARRPAKQPE